MKDDDLNLLLSGKLAAQQAYFQGRLKIKGNMGLAMKLQQLMKSNAAQIKAKLWKSCLRWNIYPATVISKNVIVVSIGFYLV